MTKGQANPLCWKFGERLRAARPAARLTASGLSVAAGMGRGSVTQLEAGNSVPLLPTAERLANALQVSAGWLVYGVSSSWAPSPELRCSGLAGRLRQLRAERGLTLAAVGRSADISANSVKSLEGQTQPTIAAAERLAEALCVSPAWLAYGLGGRDPVRRGARRAAAPAPISP